MDDYFQMYSKDSKSRDLASRGQKEKKAEEAARLKADEEEKNVNQIAIELHLTDLPKTKENSSVQD